MYSNQGEYWQKLWGLCTISFNVKKQIYWISFRFRTPNRIFSIEVIAYETNEKMHDMVIVDRKLKVCENVQIIGGYHVC